METRPSKRLREVKVGAVICLCVCVVFRTKVHDFMRRFHAEVFSVKKLMGSSVVYFRAVAGNIQGNTPDLFHVGLHTQPGPPAVRDEKETTVRKAVKNIQRVGGNGQIIPQQGIIQVKSSCLQNTTCRNQIFRPSTAAFWAGMQARNLSI